MKREIKNQESIISESEKVVNDVQKEIKEHVTEVGTSNENMLISARALYEDLQKFANIENRRLNGKFAVNIDHEQLKEVVNFDEDLQLNFKSGYGKAVEVVDKDGTFKPKYQRSALCRFEQVIRKELSDGVGAKITITIDVGSAKLLDYELPKVKTSSKSEIKQGNSPSTPKSALGSRLFAVKKEAVENKVANAIDGGKKKK